MEQKQVLGERVDAAYVRQFFSELLQEMPKSGTYVSSRQVDDLMYQ